jgi:hypothetical protein
MEGSIAGDLALRFAKGGLAYPKTMPKALAEGARFFAHRPPRAARYEI